MRKMTIAITLVVSAVLVASCSSLPSNKDASQATEAPAPVTADQPAPTDPAAPAATADPASPPAADAAAAPSPEHAVEIVHLAFPGEPKYGADQLVKDCDTGERLRLGVTTLVSIGCDNWDTAKIERPVLTYNDTYLPAVDILYTRMGHTAEWNYASIELDRSAAGNLPADLTLGFELDTDMDSRGEYLLMVSGLDTREWTVVGVQVWQDQTGDVGGTIAHSPDPQTGDGYETLLFDAGQGSDPDLAWARIHPLKGSFVEFAFKADALTGPVFAWWAWAAQGGLDPLKMEVVDYLVNADAWRMDNTCGWVLGSNASDVLMNSCP